MATVKNMLDVKGKQVWTVQDTLPIRDALKLMAEKNIGAVIVNQGEKMVGIFSERDYARFSISLGYLLLDDPVGQYTTHSVYFVTPEQTVEEVMSLMTARHIRHLPVLKDGKLTGLISIGDVVNQMIVDKDGQIQGLENFILGRSYIG
jgi:CBS domain-containing protein